MCCPRHHSLAGVVLLLAAFGAGLGVAASSSSSDAGARLPLLAAGDGEGESLSSSSQSSSSSEGAGARALLVVPYTSGQGCEERDFATFHRHMWVRDTYRHWSHHPMWHLHASGGQSCKVDSQGHAAHRFLTTQQFLA